MTSRRCFVISPIGAPGSSERQHADMVFGAVLTPTLGHRGYALERADRLPNPGQITADIFDALVNADLCIADLTFLNPNVFYELAVRHSFRKPVIQIAQDGTALPFDAANQRTIFFDVADFESHRSLAAGIVVQCQRIEDNPDAISNPLTHALGKFELSQTGDAPDTILSDLLTRVEALELQPPPVPTGIADAIYGQGDLATKSTRELQELWRADQRVATLDWQRHATGSESTEYRGFVVMVSSQSRGRWSSSANEKDGDFAVPYPTWRNSIDDAKGAIIRAVDSALSERN